MKIKKLPRKFARLSARTAKHVLGRNKRIKGFARSVILEHLNLNDLAVTAPPYQRWVTREFPDAITLFEQREASKAFAYRPLISVLTPTYNTDLTYLKECIRSVQAQSYDNWELCIVDDASPDKAVRDTIKELAAADPRITYIFREENGHISAATNDALAQARGEFIALLDHDDLLWPNALYENVKALNDDKQIDFLYSDEDKIEAKRWEHQNPFFKPDWNPEFLESVNYITHLAVLRTSVVQQVGGFRGEYNGAQDWDLFLRVTHATKKIHHIPKVLYCWRMSETSTAADTDAKPYVRNAQQETILESLRQRGYADAQVQRAVKDYWNVVHPVTGSPKVSIVIPTKNQLTVVRRCIDSILKKTTYKNYEIILVDTGSTDAGVLAWYKKLTKANSHIQVVDWPEQPFSYARSCNFGASKASGEYLLMLNNDTEVITPDWVERLLGDAQRDSIGAVGCKLYYPDGLHIQHAGIGIGFGGLAANSLSRVLNSQMTPLQHLYGNTRHAVTAVTAACLMIKKERFDEIKGFDEKFRVTYNDVDLCLRLNKAGYRNIYNPAVELLHHESISVGRPEEKQKRDTTEIDKATVLFKRRWSSVIAYDPQLNPNIERSNALFEIEHVH